MKRIMWLAVMILPLNGAAQHIDTIICYLYDSAAMEWDENTRELRFFIANDDLTEIIEQNWIDPNWENDKRTLYQYDNNKNITEDHRLNWSSTDSTWENDERYKYKYDGNDNTIESYREAWRLVDTVYQWVPKWKYTYTYDANDNLLKDFKEIYPDTAWINERQYTYTYDGNNNLLTDQLDWWDDFLIQWEPFTKYTYTYDANNNKTEDLTENWFPVQAMWFGDRKYIYSYDGNNNLIQDLEQDYDTAWVDIRKLEYIYDGNDNQTLETKIDWQDTIWVNDWHSIKDYDGNNDNIEITNQDWIDSTSSWQNDWHYDYTYTGQSDLTIWIKQDWGDTSWINDFKWEFRFDLGIQTVVFKANWDSLSGAWVNEFWDEQVYDSQGELTEWFYKIWDIPLNSWLFVSRCEVFKVVPPDTTDTTGVYEISVMQKACIFQNPYEIYGSIRCMEGYEGDYFLRLFDITGKEVYRKEFTGGKSVSIDKHFPDGLYLLLVDDGHQVLTREKIIIIRSP